MLSLGGGGEGVHLSRRPPPHYLLSNGYGYQVPFLMFQEALLYAGWTRSLVKSIDKFKEEVGPSGELLFRGTRQGLGRGTGHEKCIFQEMQADEWIGTPPHPIFRLKMGICEGHPKSIQPDHVGRADYHGPSVNQVWPPS